MKTGRQQQRQPAAAATGSNSPAGADYHTFLAFVIPSILAFALSGVYAIVDGYFVGNSIGDIGISTINVAYPIIALILAVGTGIGMGGAVYYSIFRAEGKPEKAREFVAGTLWLLLISSILLTAVVLLFARSLLKLLGAESDLLTMGEEYIFIMGIGSVLQIFGVGLTPLIRNNGGSIFAMVTMCAGFITNIILDFLFVWVMNQGVAGAAWATIIGQGVTMIGGIGYLLYKKQLTLSISAESMKQVTKSIIRIGLAPFGLSLTPNFSLILINRFSSFYGGEPAIAVYACVSYILTIVYLVLQGVGDGIQPLMSQFYGAGRKADLAGANRFAYTFALSLSILSIALLYLFRGSIGAIFGASEAVTREVAATLVIFLIAIPFIAVNRVTTASFYATEQSTRAYILTYIEPAAMLVLMLILPPLFGGQIMIWWSATIARILSAILAVILALRPKQPARFS